MTIGNPGCDMAYIETMHHDKPNMTHCHISNISHTFASNIIVEHSEVVGASPVGAAPTTSSFST